MTRRHGDLTRLTLALALIALGGLLAAGAAQTDVYLHRGIETGGEQPAVTLTTGRDLATNVDLTQYDPKDLDGVVTELQTAGFRYVRQSFAWERIEPEQGTFDWGIYDQVVDALTAHGIVPVAVLHLSPAWARADRARTQPDAPPRDAATYARFVSNVVRRYGDRIRFYQLWDLPNRPDHWGGAVAKAGDYVNLLAQGFNAARGANPDARIVLAELDPRPAVAGAPSDLAFLDRIYAARGKAFFDVVAMRLDGGTRSPYDRRAAADQPGFSRAILVRELLIGDGDPTKPIWATHYGWRAGAGAGAVSPDEQADFIVSGIKRARAEWPWMGLMFAWDFMPSGNDDPNGAYALLAPNRPASPQLTALSDFAARGGTAVAPTGSTPVDAPSLIYEGNWQDQHLGSRTFRTTSERGAQVTIRFRGTGLIAMLRAGPDAGLIHATLDGQPLRGWPVAGGTAAIDLNFFRARDLPLTLSRGLGDATHQVTLTLVGTGQLTLGGVNVVRQVPFVWPVVVLAIAGTLLLLLGIRELAYTVAIASGHLQRRRGVELRPPLPQLPDWRPSRRA